MTYAVQWRTSSQDYSEVRCVVTAAGIVSQLLEMDDLAGDTGGPLMVDAGTQYFVQVFARIGPEANPIDGEPSDEVSDTPRPDQVAKVEVTPGAEELAVTWDPVDGATGYTVEWKSGTEDWDTDGTATPPRQASGSQITGESYTIGSLMGGTQYSVRVFASNAGGDGAHSATELGIPKPGQVTGVDVTPGSGALTVTWTALTGVDDFKVQWALATDVDAEYDWSTNQELATGTSHTIVYLDPGTQYTVRVIATTEPAANRNNPEIHDGEPSTEETGTTAPSQVVNVSVVSGVEQLTVSWDAAPEATGYKVQWKSGGETFADAATATPKREASGSDISGTSHTIEDLTAGTEYTVQVIASNAGGNGPPSVEAEGIPKQLAVGQVANVVVTPGLEQLSVSWDVVQGAIGYKVQWKSGEETFADAATATPKREASGSDISGTSHTIEDLTAGTEYTVRVIAILTEDTEGLPSDPVPGILSDRLALGQVTGVTVTPGSGAITVSWTAIPGVDDYKVQWKLATDAEYDPAENQELATGTSHTIANLDPGTQYAVQVIATTEPDANLNNPEIHDGEPSTEETGTTAPSQVVNVSVVSGVEQLTVSWDAAPGATGYKVQWKSGEETFADAATATPKREASGSDISGTSHMIEDLTAGTEYTVQVIASNAGGNGPPSVEAEGIPKQLAVGQVANVVVTPGVEQLSVSWDEVQGATGYKVQWKSGQETFADAATATPKREASGSDISGTSHTIEDLTTGTEYTVQVIAILNSGTEGLPSDPVLGIPTLGQVANVRAVAGVGALMVSWKAVADATGYIVEWKSGDQPWDPSRRHQVASVLSATLSSLTAGTQYTVRVTATLGELEGATSEEAMGTPRARRRPTTTTPRQPTPPTPPTQPPPAKPPAAVSNVPDMVRYVSVSAREGGLQVRWLSLGKAGYKGPLTGYKVQWKSGSEAYAMAREDIVTGPLTWIIHTIPDLSHETEYTVRVLAFNEHGDGPASEELTGTPKQAKPSTRIAGILKGAVRGGNAQQPRGDQDQVATLGLDPAGNLDAGQEVTLTVSVAQVASYVLEVTGGRGITLTGDGVTDEGGGRAQLDAESWSNQQQRTVVLKDTAAVDTLSVALLDTDGDQVAALEPKIVYNPEVRHGLRVTGLPDTLTVNRQYWGEVTLLDRYGNVRVRDDDREVVLSANQAGVSSAPASLEAGTGRFWVRSDSLLTEELVLTFRDGAVSQSETVIVRPLDAPDQLVAADYPGDEGGFIELTWDLSLDHSILDGYRIFRTPINGEPEEWGRVAADPEAEEGRAVVATLDTVTTAWGIAAELELETEPASGGDTPVTPPPDDPEEPPTVGRSSSITLSSGIVLSTPEPPMMEEEDPDMEEDPEMDPKKVRRSSVTRSGSVRAVDNVAPSAVREFRAVDAPDDDGGRILLTWEGSLSDSLVNRRVEGAIGPTVSDMSRGVAGYRIYRQPAEGAFALLDTVGGSATSFVDTTAINAERFTYTVAAFDEDNETHSPEESAMAIRNNEVDVNGQAITGLFGADRQVGFDDYFHFADHYGSTAADVEWEPAFDLASKQAVAEAGLNVFASNFGRQTAAAAKAPALRSGRNEQTRLDFFGDVPLPRVGEEFVLTLHLSDFTLLKGYGFQLEFNGEELEVVRAVTADNGLGEGPLALPQVLGAEDGKRAIVAYGDAVSEGTVAVDLVFRALREFETGFIRVTEGQVRDGTFAVNALALPAPVEMETLPEVFALRFNYPNPFNPETTIKYALPQASDVELVVYNSLGQKVRTLVSEHQGVGRYAFTWDATNDRGHAVSSGIYLYRLQAGEFAQVRKMLLLK